MYTVYYRKADGKGTKVFMRGLAAPMAGQFKQSFFDRNPDVTMCWALNNDDHMLGDALIRDPEECETVPVQKSGQATAEHGGGGADPILREAVTPTPSTSTPTV